METMQTVADMDELNAMLAEHGLIQGDAMIEEIIEQTESPDELDAALASLAIEATADEPIVELVGAPIEGALVFADEGLDGTVETTIAEQQSVADLVLDDNVSAELDAIARDVEIVGGVEMVAAPTTIVANSDLDLEALVNALAIEDAKHEAYAGQDSSVEVQAEVAAVGPAAKVRAPRATPAPRVSRLNDTTHGSYVANVAEMPDLEAAVATLPKKVKDKATNLVDHLFKGRPLSVYTGIAVGMLRDKGAMTNAALVQALTVASKKNGGEGYTLGTAASQAGQMMALFGKLGITQGDGAKGQVPNSDNQLWQMLNVASPVAAPAASV